MRKQGNHGRKPVREYKNPLEAEHPLALTENIQLRGVTEQIRSKDIQVFEWLSQTIKLKSKSKFMKELENFISQTLCIQIDWAWAILQIRMYNNENIWIHYAKWVEIYPNRFAALTAAKD